MKKSMSFGNAKLGGSRHSAGSLSSSSIRKNVSFGNGSVRVMDTIVDEDQKNSVWYSKTELSSLRKQEVKQNTVTQQQLLTLAASAASKKKAKKMLSGNNPLLESANLTWRGLEDVQLGYNRVERSQKYVCAVLDEISMQSQAGYFNEYELRAVAKSLSKDERQKAHKLALQDEKEATEKAEKKKKLLRRSLSWKKSSEQV
jgi:hypothetical protein